MTDQTNPRGDTTVIPDFPIVDEPGTVSFPKPNERRVLEVVAHEMARCWTGNQVSSKWWNGLWLAETAS